MADLSSHLVLETAPGGSTWAYPIADGVTIPAGALVQLENGYLNHADGTDQFLGILIGGDDRAGDGVFTGETSDTPPPEGRVDESGRILKNVTLAGTVTQAKVGSKVYETGSDPNDMTLTDTTRPAVGILKRFVNSTTGDVQLFTPAEYEAGST